MKHLFRPLLALALLGPLALAATPTAAADATAHTFAATGYTVSDLFWRYWQDHGGLAIFGYPISGEFTEVSPLDGKPYTVQYFERAVFELHPTIAAPYTVLQVQLGRLRYDSLYPQGAPGQQAAPGAVLVPATGKHLGDRFLAYWQSHGSVAVLGYPISEPFTELSALNGKPYTVQYFERAVLEAHPENQAPYDVLLSQLGTLRLHARYPNGAPAPPPAPAAGPAPLPGDWPMYGADPQRTNFNAAETAISAATVGQLAPLWQANVGSGPRPPSGAPSVANGAVYVGSSVVGSANFFAFDAATGAARWQANLGRADACYNIGIGATPAVSGTVVVAGGGDGAYYGLDTATGRVLWRDATDAQPDDFAWTSPLFVGNRVVYGVASYCDKVQVRGELRAVDPGTGVLRATQYFAPASQIGGSLWESPALSADGQTLVVATGEDRGPASGPLTRALAALDPGSLAVRTAVQEGQSNVDDDWGTTPVIFHDAAGHVLVGAGQKDDNFYAYRLDALAAGPIWVQRFGTQIGLMAAYDPTDGPGGTLFVPGTHQYLHAVDPATGVERWPAVQIGTAHGNIAVANGLIFVNAGGEGVRVLDEHTGRQIRLLAPANVGATNSGVVVAHGVVYWLSGAYLNAWGLPGATP